MLVVCLIDKYDKYPDEHDPWFNGTVIDTQANAVRDVAFNPNAQAQNILLDVVPDTTRPSIHRYVDGLVFFDCFFRLFFSTVYFLALLIFFPTMINVILFSATLNYSTGIVLMTFTETIDVPLGWSTTTNLQHVHLQNNSAPSNNGTGTISMLGAFVTVRDSHVVEITLVEEQRARAIALSGVVGGDGASLVLDMFVRRQVIPLHVEFFILFFFFHQSLGPFFQFQLD
jgi:hypothetical protein